jgi:hypothetical protein
MGACFSAKDDDEVVLDKGKNKSEEKSDGRRKSGKMMSDDDRRVAEAEFRECIKLVTLLILNRLVTALEYEKEGFDDLRKVRRLNTYMDLIGPKHFEGLFREVLDISGERKPIVDAKHISYEQQRYIAMLDACETAEFRAGLSVKDIADRFQKAAKATQEELAKSAAASDSSDLKIELNFFGACLDFMKGDVGNNPELIFEQVDKMVMS